MIRSIIPPDVPPCKCGGEARWYYESGFSALRGVRGSGFIMCSQCSRATDIHPYKIAVAKWEAGA